MYLGIRSPYAFFRDEMERIPFEGRNWEIWMRKDNEKREGLLFHFMIWSNLLLTTAFLAVPFWLATELGLVLLAPIVAATVTFALFIAYKGLGKV